jgi:polyisoprenoid-binding protein YceI
MAWPGSALPPPGTYRLDPARSMVRAEVKAIFGLITVRGTFRLLSGQVVIAPDPAGSSVRASIDARSFTSGSASRDREVLSAALLNAAAYPEITFAADGARADGGDWVLRGLVTARGTADPVQLRVRAARVENGVARFRAFARLDRARFGVTGRNGMAGTSVDVTIDAVGRPA